MLIPDDFDLLMLPIVKPVLLDFLILPIVNPVFLGLLKSIFGNPDKLLYELFLLFFDKLLLFLLASEELLPKPIEAIGFKGLKPP